MHPLAGEIRTFLVDQVSRTGGHLGPNLGAVELTLALHRVFESPRDRIVWDTGHQAYVHKILTGRRGRLRAPAQPGRPVRLPEPRRVASTTSSRTATPRPRCPGRTASPRRTSCTGQLGRRSVVAVIGDGALTGGMAWEALNNIAAAKSRPMVIVVNDNARSYAPTIGGMAHHLATLRTTGGYERFLEWGRSVLGRTPVVGPPLYDTLHGMKKGIKDIVAPQGLFEDLGLKYVGPVDGHDIAAMEQALRRARAYDGPVIVHAITHKGLGYQPAEQDEEDQFHAVGVIDPVDRTAARAGRSRPGRRSSAPRWSPSATSAVTSSAITAAMLAPGRADGLRRGVPRAGVRRRDRRAARHDVSRRDGLRRAAPGGRDLRDVPQPRLRPGADGLSRCTRPA